MKIKEERKQAEGLVEIIQQNRHWWEEQLKHRHKLSDHDLHHMIDVIDNALKDYEDKPDAE